MVDRNRGRAESDETEMQPEQREEILQKAEDAGIDRPVVETVIDDALSEGVAPEKLEEVVIEAAQVEMEDQDLAGTEDESKN